MSRSDIEFGKTLPDYLADGLDLVVIGQNPSPEAVRRQVYYGNPRNRFWRAFIGAGLAPSDFEPSPAGHAWLLKHERIGFTDVVKRPTPSASDLRAADFRRWAPVLAEKIERFGPRVLWFNGKGVYQSFLRYGLEERPEDIDFGRQPDNVLGRPAMVTPNPSPANAAFSLEVLTDWYDQVAELRVRLKG